MAYVYKSKRSDHECCNYAGICLLFEYVCVKNLKHRTMQYIHLLPQVIAGAIKMKLFANILWCVPASASTQQKHNTSQSLHGTYNWKVICGLTLWFM
jgi:hypothetical protein